MSAALQFPTIARAAAAQRHWRTNRHTGTLANLKACAAPANSLSQALPVVNPDPGNGRRHAPHQRPVPPPTLAFYRKHTETLLRRYLYSSILVGRAPAILKEPVIRGCASSRPVKTFEDCVIFVLDMEKALSRISALERLLLTRIVLQEYSVAETALLLNKSQRTIGIRPADALDRLTRILLDNGTLKIPNRPDPEPDDDLDD